MGQGNKLAIGGYISLPEGEIWFWENFCIEDFASAQTPLRSGANRDYMLRLSGLDCLDRLLGTLHPCCRMAVRMHSWCENTGAEASANSLFATSWPLAAFTQRLALMSSYTGVHKDVHHVAGPKPGDRRRVTLKPRSCSGLPARR